MCIYLIVLRWMDEHLRLPQRMSCGCEYVIVDVDLPVWAEERVEEELARRAGDDSAR